MPDDFIEKVRENLQAATESLSRAVAARQLAKADEFITALNLKGA